MSDDKTVKDEVPGNINGKQIIEQYIHPSGNDIIVSGPLAVAYSEALDKLYEKRKDPISGMSLETQAIDALHAQEQVIEATAAKIFADNQAANLGLLYGVEKGKTTPEDLISVTDTLSAMTDSQKNKSGIVIDVKLKNENSGTMPVLEHGKKIFPMDVALEELCKRHKVPVYNSIKQYIISNS